MRLYAKASKNGFASAAEIRLYNEPVLNGLSLSDTAVTIYPGQPYHLGLGCQSDSRDEQCEQKEYFSHNGS